MFDERSILAGWLIDGTGAPFRKNVFLRIMKGVFHEIRPFSFGTMTPPGLLDFSGYTLLPPLADAHVHLFMSGTVDPDRRKRQLNQDFRRVKTTISKHLEQLVAHGVLSVRDGGDKNGYALRYKKQFHQQKYSVNCLHVAGKAWHKQGRYGSFVGQAVGRGTLAEEILRFRDDIDHVKIIQSGLNSLQYFGRESLPQFPLKAMKDAMEAASILGLKTMVHANGKLPVQIALKAGCGSIEHGFFMGEENLALMAEMGVYWVPTACTMKAYGQYAHGGERERRIALKNLEHQLEQMTVARKLGVPMAVGTDSGSTGVHHGSALIDELRLFQDAGFSIEEAIRCASFNSANLMGLEGKGCIKKGMQANFLVVKGPPSALPESLKDIYRIHAGEGFP